MTEAARRARLVITQLGGVCVQKRGGCREQNKQAGGVSRGAPIIWTHLCRENGPECCSVFVGKSILCTLVINKYTLSEGCDGELTCGATAPEPLSRHSPSLSLRLRWSSLYLFLYSALKVFQLPWCGAPVKWTHFIVLLKKNYARINVCGWKLCGLNLSSVEKFLSNHEDWSNILRMISGSAPTSHVYK